MDITNRNQGEDLDESIQINEVGKHNKFREDLSQEKLRVNLTAGNMIDLSHNRLLNEKIIQTFQQMLKIQYPNANGLQDPVLGQALILAVYQTIPLVQLLHGGLHWGICSSISRWSKIWHLQNENALTLLSSRTWTIPIFTCDRNHRKYIHKSISIALFGNCRIPWATSDIRLIDKKM